MTNKIILTVSLVILLSGCATENYLPFYDEKETFTGTPYEWTGETLQHRMKNTDTLQSITKLYNSNLLVIYKINPDKITNDLRINKEVKYLTIPLR